MSILILLTALLPVAILVFYIYRKDKNLPEPTGQLVKAFFYGVISAPSSFFISIPLGMIGLYLVEDTTVLGSVSSAFFGAAIPGRVQSCLFCGWCCVKIHFLMKRWMVLYMLYVFR